MKLTPLTASSVPAAERLDALVGDVWTRIERALDGTWPPWALPVIATVGPTGASARVLALRSADAASRTFVFHTDARSDKVREIRADPMVSVLFWDAADGIEARFTGSARLHLGDAVAVGAWNKVSPLRRMASRQLHAPRTGLEAASRFDALPENSDGNDGSGNFAVIEVVVSGLDWLWVGADDMRRASFAWNDTAWQGSWVVP